MPRQKISNDCWPQRINGFAAGERKNIASSGTKALTTTTMAKKGTSRIGDKLLLLTGQSSFRRIPGNGSHSPWIVQLSLMTNPAAAMTMAINRSTPAGHGQRRVGTVPKPRAAPAVNRNCQARGLKYQTCPSG